MSRSLYDRLADGLRRGEPLALATVIEGEGIGAKLIVGGRLGSSGGLGSPGLDRVVTRDALAALAGGTSAVRHYGVEGQAGERSVTVFIESFASPPKFVIFGAVDFTAALAAIARAVGFHVIVCDAREVFATAQRFPMADEVVVDWPHRLVERLADDLGERDVVCVLTHDHKFDIPALRAALSTPVGYIGAMGSRRTHDERARLLVEAGVEAADLRRLHSPIGLDIGARSPEETAVAICAEVIASRTGRVGAPLRDTEGPIH